MFFAEVSKPVLDFLTETDFELVLVSPEAVDWSLYVMISVSPCWRGLPFIVPGISTRPTKTPESFPVSTIFDGPEIAVPAIFEYAKMKCWAQIKFRLNFTATLKSNLWMPYSLLFYEVNS